MRFVIAALLRTFESS